MSRGDLVSKVEVRALGEDFWFVRKRVVGKDVRISMSVSWVSDL